MNEFGLIGSFVLAAVGILGIFLAGSGKKAGWALGVFAQVLWITFGVVTGQYGFVLTGVAYGIVYARNWLRWRREERLKKNEEGWVPLTELRRPPRSGANGGRVVLPTGPTPPGGAQRPRRR